MFCLIRIEQPAFLVPVGIYNQYVATGNQYIAHNIYMVAALCVGMK